MVGSGSGSDAWVIIPRGSTSPTLHVQGAVLESLVTSGLMRTISLGITHNVAITSRDVEALGAATPTAVDRHHTVHDDRDSVDRVGS